MTTRARMWSALGARHVDILVVGGGITGAGIARDAALRGLTVALVESRDLAFGTSSRSTKLVHGGLRYLEQGELGLVFESVNERRVLARMAPHLVRPLGFVFPVFENAARSLGVVDAGLFVYEALSLFRSPRRHRKVSREALRHEEPALGADALQGAALYYDCATDDARLTLEVALDAARLGATIATHAEVVRLLRDEGGAVVGARVRCGLGGGEQDVFARAVVNATGPWTDSLLRLGGATRSRVLRPTKGVHVVVDREKLPLRHAVLLQHPRDQRVMFAIPWGERSYLGTTDTDADQDPGEVRATRADVDYLLEAARTYFPGHPLADEDVLATWAGLRPLLAPPETGDHLSESQVSREHHLFVDRDGLVTIAGGKLTTFRVMAMQTVDEVVRRLDLRASGGPLHDRRTRRRLPAALDPEDRDAYACVRERARIAAGGMLDGAALDHLVLVYGGAAVDVAAYVGRDPRLAERLDGERHDVLAAVHHAVEHELAATVDDVLVRRTQAFFRAADQGLSAAPRVAAELGLLLGLSEDEQQRQVYAYRAEVARSRAFRADASR